jgi:hypothetical protein
MTQNIEQHKLFHDGFEEMETYFGKVQKNPSLYDGNKVRGIIEKFGAVFTNHLTEEITTLERSNLIAIFPDINDLKKIWVEQIDWVISTSNKLTLMPWVFQFLKRF